jgi:hypothetical protein
MVEMATSPSGCGHALPLQAQRRATGTNYNCSTRRRNKADGSIKTYGCWTFHWIEEGKHKIERIGSDKQLEEWKKHYP